MKVKSKPKNKKVKKNELLMAKKKNEKPMLERIYSLWNEKR